MITYDKALRAAWLILIAALVGSVITVIVLAVGVADPPRAGSLQWHTDNLVHTAAQLENFVFPQQINLPIPPYTLEVSGTFNVDSDSLAIWGISLLHDSTEIFGVYLNGYQFYRVPPTQPDFTPFIHIRKNGTANKLTLNVDTDNHATLRINDEVAWQGTISRVSSARIAFIGGADHPSTLTIESISLFYPTR